MRTGLDILFDNMEESKGIVEAAMRLLRKGISLEETANLLDLSYEQVEQVKLKAGLGEALA